MPPACTDPLIVCQWGIIPPPERLACQAMGIGTLGMSGFVPVDSITPLFAAYSPLWYELRRDTWQTLWNVTKTTVIIDEVEIEVYLVDQQWMYDLAECQQGGGCDPEADYTEPLNYMTLPIDVTT